GGSWQIFRVASRWPGPVTITWPASWVCYFTAVLKRWAGCCLTHTTTTHANSASTEKTDSSRWELMSRRRERRAEDLRMNVWTGVSDSLIWLERWARRS